MARILTPEDLNKLVEPLYTITPVLAYHLAITIFLAISVFLTVMQQGFNFLVEYAFITTFQSGSTFLRALGIIWYITWGVGFFTIIPLYYVSLHNIERYFRESSDLVFQQLKVKVIVKKDQLNKFVLIDGFKKIDSLEITTR